MTNAIDVANRALSSAGARTIIANFNEKTPQAAQVSLWYDRVLRQVFRAAYWNFAKAFVELSLYKAAPTTPEFQSGAGDFNSDFGPDFSTDVVQEIVASGVWNPIFPPPPWNYEYLYPDDCLAARYVIGQTPGFSVPENWPVPYSFSLPQNPQSSFEVVQDRDPRNNPIKAIVTNAIQAILCYTKYVDDPNFWDPDFEDAVVSGLAGKVSFPLSGDKELAKEKIQEANMIIMQARARDANEGTSINDIVPDWLKVRGIVSNDYNGGAIIALPPFGPLLTLVG